MFVLLLLRILAQLVDVFLGLFLLVGSYLIVPPFLISLGFGDFLSGTIAFILALTVLTAMQFFFFGSNQTVGKAFFGLVIETTNPDRPLTKSILFQREVFLKLFTLFIICLPVFWMKPGGHEISTETRVIRVKRNVS